MAPAGFKLPEGTVHVKGRGTAQAKALIERAEELGIDASEIVTTSVGYLVPEALVERTEEGEAQAPTPDLEVDGSIDPSTVSGNQDPDDQTQTPETPDENLAAYDPSEHNVDQVTEYLEGADDAERERVIAAEKDGKARKTILDLANTGKDSE